MIFRSPAKRARLLALFLLASISWVTTAEFNHHHGGKARFSQSLSTTEAQNADDASSVKIESSETNGTSSSRTTGAECLICQLHQNLSATALGHTPGIGTVETHGPNAPPSVGFQLSEFTANCQGRAPPSNL